MNRIRRVSLLLFAAMACLASVNCRHVKKDRSMKIDICKECTELVDETILKALEDLEHFSRCLEIKTNSTPILDGSEKNIKETKDEMVTVLTTFIQQIKLIQNVWENNRLPSCPQNLEKHLTRILCLSRGVSKKAEGCLAKRRIRGPNSENLVDYTGNYIRTVHHTLEGFVSKFQ